MVFRPAFHLHIVDRDQRMWWWKLCYKPDQSRSSFNFDLTFDDKCGTGWDQAVQCRSAWKHEWRGYVDLDWKRVFGCGMRNPEWDHGKPRYVYFPCEHSGKFRHTHGYPRCGSKAVSLGANHCRGRHGHFRLGYPDFGDSWARRQPNVY